MTGVQTCALPICASKKATELGAKVIAISGPDGVVTIPNGMNEEMIDYMLELRASNRNIVAPFAEKFAGTTFTPGKKAWSVKCDIALPCAFQNELNGDDAAELLKNGTWCCAEVSNMGCTPEAIHAFQKAGILFAPGKADRKSTRLNSSHITLSRMPSSA